MILQSAVTSAVTGSQENTVHATVISWDEGDLSIQPLEGHYLNNNTTIRYIFTSFRRALKLLIILYLSYTLVITKYVFFFKQIAHHQVQVLCASQLKYSPIACCPR